MAPIMNGTVAMYNLVAEVGPGDPDSRESPISDSDIIRQGSILACNIGLAYITVHVRAQRHSR